MILSQVALTVHRPSHRFSHSLRQPALGHKWPSVTSSPQRHISRAELTRTGRRERWPSSRSDFCNYKCTTQAKVFKTLHEMQSQGTSLEFQLNYSLLILTSLWFTRVLLRFTTERHQDVVCSISSYTHLLAGKSSMACVGYCQELKQLFMVIQRQGTEEFLLSLGKS